MKRLIAASPPIKVVPPKWSLLRLRAERFGAHIAVSIVKMTTKISLLSGDKPQDCLAFFVFVM